MGLGDIDKEVRTWDTKIHPYLLLYLLWDPKVHWGRQWRWSKTSPTVERGHVEDFHLITHFTPPHSQWEPDTNYPSLSTGQKGGSHPTVQLLGGLIQQILSTSRERGRLNIARGVKRITYKADHTVDIARRVKGRRLLGLVPSLVNHISWRRNSSEVGKCYRTMRLRSVGKVELKSRDCCCWSVWPKHNTRNTYFSIKVVENNRW